MRKQYNLKEPYFSKLTPLLDRGFDEMPSDGISNFSVFHSYPLDEHSYPMQFNTNVER